VRRVQKHPLNTDEMKPKHHHTTQVVRLQWAHRMSGRMQEKSADAYAQECKADGASVSHHGNDQVGTGRSKIPFFQPPVQVTTDSVTLLSPIAGRRYTTPIDLPPRVLRVGLFDDVPTTTQLMLC
jgi:hypothetical protein